MYFKNISQALLPLTVKPLEVQGGTTSQHLLQKAEAEQQQSLSTEGRPMTHVLTAHP